MRRAAKRDANENDLVGPFEQLGGVWVQTGPLDGWALWRERWYPVEIKNPDGKNRYTEAQVLFLARCKERNAPVWTWRTERDVMACIGARVAA